MTDSRLRRLGRTHSQARCERRIRNKPCIYTHTVPGLIDPVQPSGNIILTLFLLINLHPAFAPSGRRQSSETRLQASRSLVPEHVISQLEVSMQCVMLPMTKRGTVVPRQYLPNYDCSA